MGCKWENFVRELLKIQHLLLSLLYIYCPLEFSEFQGRLIESLKINKTIQETIITNCLVEIQCVVKGCRMLQKKTISSSPSNYQRENKKIIFFRKKNSLFMEKNQDFISKKQVGVVHFACNVVKKDLIKVVVVSTNNQVDTLYQTIFT